MAKNVGKVFEEDFKDSVPENCYLKRLNDPPHSFTQREDTKYSKKNPYDFLMFCGDFGMLFCLELKTTSGKSISYDDIKSDENKNRMIKKHQILGLTNVSKYKNVIAGFLLNFRDEKNDTERLYFIDINDFNAMVRKLDKHSCSEVDLILNHAKKVSGVKKRIHFSWDIDSLIKELCE